MKRRDTSSAFTAVAHAMNGTEITISCIHFSRKMLSRIYFCVFLQWLCSCIFSKMLCDWWSVIPHPRLEVSCNCWRLGRLLMSILPLQVEEIKRRQYTLAFTSAGAQAQTYHISFETLAECQRWHRQASTVRPRGRCGLDGGCRVHHRKGILMQAWSAVRDEVRILEKVPRTLSSFISFML